MRPSARRDAVGGALPIRRLLLGGVLLGGIACIVLAGMQRGFWLEPTPERALEFIRATEPQLLELVELCRAMDAPHRQAIIAEKCAHLGIEHAEAISGRIAGLESAVEFYVYTGWNIPNTTLVSLIWVEDAAGHSSMLRWAANIRERQREGSHAKHRLVKLTDHWWYSRH